VPASSVRNVKSRDLEIDHRASAAAAGVRAGFQNGQPADRDLAEIEFDEDGIAPEAGRSTRVIQRGHAGDVFSRVCVEEALKQIREDALGFGRRQRRRGRRHAGRGLCGRRRCETQGEQDDDGSEGAMHQRVRRRAPGIGLTSYSPEPTNRATTAASSLTPLMPPVFVGAHARSRSISPQEDGEEAGIHWPVSSSAGNWANSSTCPHCGHT
jgi:hypothetical protein